jgi:hypothetical protein
MIFRHVPSRTLPIARLVKDEVQALIGGDVEPRLQAQQELLALWDSLSLHAREAVLTAARLAAREEGRLPDGQGMTAQDAEAS